MEIKYGRLLNQDGLNAGMLAKRNLFMNIKKIFFILFVIMFYVIGSMN